MPDSNSTSVIPSTESQGRKRPMHLTLMSIALVLWGCVTTISFGIQTLSIISTGNGPIMPILFMLYMHLVWVCIAVAGVGIARAAPWSRLLLVGALIGLLMATSITQFAYGDFVPKVLVYGGLIWALFNRRSNEYFSTAVANA